MDRSVSEYYDGYEGEPEIRFIKGSDKGDRTIVSIWDGYFDDIMRQFKPTNIGWQGLAYYYHLRIGWEDGQAWEIPDLHSALMEFQSIDASRLEFSGSAKVLSAIRDLLRSAIKEKQKVWIDKD